MKKIVLGLVLILTVTVVKSQQLSIPSDSIIVYLDEVKQATKLHEDLWGIDLYSSILLVNPKTREVFANEADEDGVLEQEGKLYKGILPKEINIANTAIDWNGTRWAMYIMPAIPKDKLRRLTLFAHELFHKAQPSLGFRVTESDNSHLDTKDGRIYLRLELEALKKSIDSNNENDRTIHLTNAIAFRKYRNILFSNSSVHENLMELNEGMAEYTGQTVSHINEQAFFFEQSINELILSPTYVRSFGYKTIPAYGYLAGKIKPDWNKDIDIATNLLDYFANIFKIDIPAKDLESYVQNRLQLYDGNRILAEETERELRNQERLVKFRTKFIEKPHLEICLENMNFSFDPRNISSLDGMGKVYSRIRISDTWGILTATNGALMSPNFKKLIVSEPNAENNLEGDGWVLELNENYTVIEEDGIFKVKKY